MAVVPEPDDKSNRISPVEKVNYKTLYSSVLISYDTLSIGDSIGEGMFPFLSNLFSSLSK